MKELLLENFVLADGFENGGASSLAIRGGAIVESVTAGSPEVIDLAGAVLVPGFVDVHIHGAAGVDVNSASAEELLAAAAFLAKKGVTAWVPTLVPDSDENYRRVIGEIDRLMDIQAGKPVAQAVGVHYEGVFASEKMCGALRPEYFKDFTGAELSDLPRLKSGVHMMTFAPEVGDRTGANSLAAELVREGWVASIGHTRADVETLNSAFAAGAGHMTHFFNAMTGIHHRDIGVAGWGLAHPEVTFDIIADGVHVHPAMLEFACRTKTADKVVLISDSVAPAGLGDGEFEIWGEKVSVNGGRTRNERGSIAGSVITMHDAFVRMLSLGFSIADVAKMASANPARLLGIGDSHGSIESGRRADLVAVDNDGMISFVMIGGEVVDLG